jgi:predicted peroxiredoxin
VKFVYIASRGINDPTLASVPFHLAVNGSVAVGHDTAVVLVGDAAELVLAENAETVEGVGLPPLRDLIAKVREHEVPVYV